MSSPRLVVREERQWEQIVFAEVLVPNVVNSYGDISTEQDIVNFAYEFARQGYGIDVDHDEEDITGQAYVVESFIAREGDTDFIPGSWVIGMKIPDPDIWQRVLDGELNGFSYQALVNMTPVTFTGTSGQIVMGRTSEHPIDGHTHTYLVVLDVFNSPGEGATSEENGHSHKILSATTTEVTDGHNHRYQVIPV